MQKIIRERYESGELVAREVEVAGVRWDKAAKLALHAVVALSLAIIAIVLVADSLLARYENAGENAARLDSSCGAGAARTVSM